MSKNFAVIENDRVINIIVAETLAIAEELTVKECIETDGLPWIGWTRSDNTWIAPVEPTEEPTND